MSNQVQIILIIGLTKESSHWDQDFVTNIKNNFETDDLVMVDLPGSGERVHEKSPLSIDEIVESSHHFYGDRFAKNKKRILISISMGGMVGSRWCHLYPKDFDAFVIMNSSFKNLSGLTKRVQPSAMKEFIKIFMTLDHEKREEKIIKLCSNRVEKHPKILKQWTKLAIKSAMSQENMVRQTIAAAKYKLDFQLDIPVLIIVALHDRLAHHTCSKQLKEYWGSDYHEIDNPSVGHAIHIDASEEVPEIIHQWTLKQSV